MIKAMEQLNNTEIYRQELQFEIDVIALQCLAKHIEIEEQATRDIEDIEEAWFQDTLECL